MSELLFCPFCGGEADTWDGAGPWHVVCTKCGTVGSPCLTEAEAIAAWNTRADDYRQAAGYWRRMYEEAFAERTCEDVNEEDNDFTCSECGASMYTQIDDCWTMIAKGGLCDDVIERPNYCPNCGAKVVG